MGRNCTMKQFGASIRGARFTAGVVFLLMVAMIARPVEAGQKKSGAAKNDSSLVSTASDEMLTTWKTEVKGIAAELGLTKDRQSKLTEVFIAARKRQRDAVRALPEEADRIKSRAAIEVVNVKERTSLEKALQGILTAEQMTKALPLLGSFNHRWDSMVKTLSTLKLEKEKLHASLKLVGTFVTEYDKARSEAAASGTRFSSSVTRDLKAKLDAGMTPLLTAEQLTLWNDGTKSGKAPSTDAPPVKKGGKVKATEVSKGAKDATKLPKGIKGAQVRSSEKNTGE
jgi:hypothetical protein